MSNFRPSGEVVHYDSDDGDPQSLNSWPPHPPQSTESQPQSRPPDSRKASDVQSEGELKKSRVKDHMPAKSLPIWKWRKDSCALDGIALIPLLAFLEDPKSTLSACQDDLLPREFRTVVGACSGYGGEWATWYPDQLTALRDLVRAGLKRTDGKQLIVNMDTALDHLHANFAPATLSTVKVCTTYKCTKPACRASSGSRDGYYFHRFKDGLDGLYFHSELQKDSNTQRLIQTLVFLVFLSSNVNRKENTVTPKARTHATGVAISANNHRKSSVSPPRSYPLSRSSLCSGLAQSFNNIPRSHHQSP